MIHGLVLAGGLGSRLAADGVETPKALTEVAGLTLAERAVAGLAAAGVTGQAIVVLEAEAARWMRERGRTGFRGAVTRAVSTPTSLHSLVEGLAALPAGPVLCTMVDTVMPDAAWRAAGSGLRGAVAAGADAALVVTAAEPDDNPLQVALDQDHRIIDFPTGPVGEGGLVTAGVYLFGPAARRRAAESLAAGTERMRGFLRSLLPDLRLTAVPVARAVDVDHVRDLVRAEGWLGAGAIPIP